MSSLFLRLPPKTIIKTESIDFTQKHKCKTKQKNGGGYKCGKSVIVRFSHSLFPSQSPFLIAGNSNPSRGSLSPSFTFVCLFFLTPSPSLSLPLSHFRSGCLGTASFWELQVGSSYKADHTHARRKGLNTLNGQEYVDTWKWYPYVTVEQLIPKPWTFICCCNCFTLLGRLSTRIWNLAAVIFSNTATGALINSSQRCWVRLMSVHYAGQSSSSTPN